VYDKLRKHYLEVKLNRLSRRDHDNKIELICWENDEFCSLRSASSKKIDKYLV